MTTWGLFQRPDTGLILENQSVLIHSTNRLKKKSPTSTSVVAERVFLLSQNSTPTYDKSSENITIEGILCLDEEPL